MPEAILAAEAEAATTMTLQRQIDDLRERVVVLEDRLHQICERLNTDLLRIDVLWRERKRKREDEDELA